MTTAQILQFLIVIAHTTQLFFFKDCDYPILFGWWIISYASIFLILFSHFYYQVRGLTWSTMNPPAPFSIS